MKVRTWAILASRLVIFALVQAVIYLTLRAVQPAATWASSAPWWVVTAAVTNLFSIGILAWAMRLEGKRFADVYHFDRSASWWRDLLLAVLLMAGAGFFAVVPNVVVGTALFGDAMIPYNMMFQPLPLWAALVGLVIFPLTIALAELPTYFGYGMPHVEQETGSRWRAVLVPALFLAAQHVTLPLLFDIRFFGWRLLMFLPLALYVGLVLRWRLRLLPYMAVLHGLLDFQAALMVYQLSVVS
jgi:hypothetical protein